MDALNRFIIVDHQEIYYMQKYLLNISITPKDDVIVHPPLSWIQVAMKKPCTSAS